jgi:hypothetical protein
MKKIKTEKLISITGYILLIIGFILFVSKLNEGSFLVQLGFILCLAGLGIIIISYEIMARKLKAENHKFRKDIKKMNEINPEN